MNCNGNTYVGSDPGTGTEIRKFTGNGKSARFEWELDDLETVSAGGFDPSTDGHDIYSTNTHYSMDYSDPNRAK